METQTQTAAVASRSSRHPRPMETYRAARRNAGRKDWPNTATYEPYKIKPDRFRLVNVPQADGTTKLVRQRYAVAQPRSYQPGWRSAAERKARIAAVAAIPMAA